MLKSGKKFFIWLTAAAFTVAWLTATMALMLSSKAVQAAIGGGGTESDPYIISTAADLKALADSINGGTSSYRGMFIKLTADIDLSPYGANYNGGKGWTPIGAASNWPFSGNFNGNGYAITGLYINDTGRDYAGLFGYVSNSSALRNIALENANVKGRNNVGGVAGCIEKNTFITGCYVSGSVSGAGSAGGIVGLMNGSTTSHDGGTVENCYVKDSVSGTTMVGGIAGRAFGGDVKTCYAACEVSSSNNAGGITGYADSSKIKDCVAINPKVAGDTNIGRVNGGGTGYSLINNCAIAQMKNKSGSTAWNNKGYSNPDGQDAGLDLILTSGFWKDYFLSWHLSGVWNIADGRLPILNVAGGSQNGEMPGDFRIDISSAAVTLSPTQFVYGGNLQTPASVTVIFDGKILDGDIDYTWEITSSDDDGASAGINAGTVTVTIKGKGFYIGSVTASYLISKAAGAAVATPEVLGTLSGTIVIKAVPAPANGQSVEYAVGASGNVSDIIAGWQDDAYFDGLPGEEYYIFARAKANNNYSEGPAASRLVYMKPPVICVNLPAGKVGIAYNYQMEADKPAEWSVCDGTMPNGLSINGNGLISGVPESAGRFTFTVMAANAAGFDLLIASIEIGYYKTGFAVTIKHSADEMSATILIVPSGETLEDKMLSANGYVFKGFYTDASCTQTYDPSTAITSDMALYAKWEKAQAVNTPTATLRVLPLLPLALTAGTALILISREKKSADKRRQPK